MTASLRFNNTFTGIIFLFLLTSITITVIFYHRDYRNDVNQLKIHSTIIADDVWAVNPSGAAPYLELAMQVNSYKDLVVTQLGGEPFIQLTSPPLTGLERAFFRLHLIWLRDLSSDIFFKDQKIGRLQVKKYVRVIYPLANILIFLFLITLTVVFFASLYSNRKNLEHQVSERTKNLQESERRFHDLVNLLPEMVWETDLSGKVLFANKITNHRLSLSASNDQSTGWFDLVVPDQRNLIRNHFEKSLFGHDQGLKEFRLIGKNQEDFPVLLRSAPILQNDMVVGARIIAIDISERHALEEQLRRAQKMKAIGLMAGGVAHDLNNILSGVINYPELMLIDLPPDSPFRLPLEAIRKSGLQAAEVVSDLLTVARGVAAVKVVIDPHALILEYLDSPEFLQLAVLNPDLSVTTEFTADYLISCSPVHFKKCLMNLVTNAMEAMSGKGTITITTANRTIIDSESGKDLPPAGEYAIITISDNGPGIKPKDIKHIFEPFYTKKTMGRSGTGLGLAVVWNTMKDHDGIVTVTSDPAVTTFELFFPRATENYSRNAVAVDPTAFRGQGQCILVVDDEQQQRDIALQILTSLGYEVITVASGEEAVDIIQDREVDLLILDMIMGPGMNGRETYERILAIHPDKKAIISSGYSQSAEVQAAQALGAGGFISKPFTMEQLGKIVYKELYG